MSITLIQSGNCNLKPQTFFCTFETRVLKSYSSEVFSIIFFECAILFQVRLLQNVYTELQEFLMNLTISHYNNVQGLRSTMLLVARLENHLCSIHSLLRTEKELFERNLELPSCEIRKTSWQIGSGTQCINFSITNFVETRKKMRQFLLDIDDLFIRKWE